MNAAAAIPMPIGMVPQWPRVVTAVMLQLPSNLAALAGGAEPTIAEAADSAKAHIRLPIMGVPLGLLNRNRNRQCVSTGTSGTRDTWAA